RLARRVQARAGAHRLAGAHRRLGGAGADSGPLAGVAAGAHGGGVDRRYGGLFCRSRLRPAPARAGDQPRQDLGRSLRRARRHRRVRAGVARLRPGGGEAGDFASRRRPVGGVAARAHRGIDRRRPVRVAAQAPARGQGQRPHPSRPRRRARPHRRAARGDAGSGTYRTVRAAMSSAQALRRITILGATGSIGASTLDVIARHPQRFAVAALCANRQWQPLLEQIARFRPAYAALLDAQAAGELAAAVRREGLPTSVLCGPQGLCEVATLPEVDTVVAAIVGAAGLAPTLAAARAGKTILLANKETLVLSGSVFIAAVRAGGATLLPIDSEHNAIFQCLPPGYAGAPEE